MTKKWLCSGALVVGLATITPVQSNHSSGVMGPNPWPGRTFTAPAACSLNSIDSAARFVADQEPSRARVTRHLFGNEALAFIAGREAGDATFREVQRKAAHLLRVRGLQRTDIAMVARIEVPQRAVQIEQSALLSRIWQKLAPTLYAEVIEGYDVIAQSWDDGDNGTWEGNAYVQQLSSGHWISANEQQQLPPEPNHVNWAEQVSTNMQPQSWCRRTGSPCGYCGSGSAPQCNMVRALGGVWWQDCSLAAGMCRNSGPGWLACTGIGCYGSIWYGYFNYTKAHLSQCWWDEQDRLACGG